MFLINKELHSWIICCLSHLSLDYIQQISHIKRSNWYFLRFAQIYISLPISSKYTHASALCTIFSVQRAYDMPKSNSLNPSFVGSALCIDAFVIHGRHHSYEYAITSYTIITILHTAIGCLRMDRYVSMAQVLILQYYLHSDGSQTQSTTTRRGRNDYSP
jgi:hypothetical protein